MACNVEERSSPDSPPRLSYFKKLSNVNLENVCGLEERKEVLKEAAIWPRRFPSFFTGNRKPWRAILLFGPPGTGKTLLAKAVAAESDCYFSSISPSAIMHKLMGQSEKHVRDLFQEARGNTPSIIFIDEIDSLCGVRGGNNENEASRRVKSELLVQMQDVCDGEESVLILAATNTPYALDQALRRRFDMQIYIPLPNEEARKHIFRVHIGKTPHSIGEEELEQLAKDTEGFSGSDIFSYVKDALYEPIRPTLKATLFFKTDEVWLPCSGADVVPETCVKSMEQLEQEQQISKIHVPEMTLADFNKVRGRHKRTVNEADLNQLKEYDDEFGAYFLARGNTESDSNVEIASGNTEPDSNVEGCWSLFINIISIIIFIIIFFLINRYPYASGFFCFFFCFCLVFLIIDRTLF